MLLLFTFKSQAQSFIKGIIKDSVNAPVPFCSLALLKASDSSIVKGNVTNEAGEFIFSKVTKGTYFIKVSGVGFADYFSNAVDADSLSQLKLDPIVLKKSATNLKEVAVTAFKPAVEFKNGMIVLNVENNILATGNTVLELLKRIPGVTVDVQNNVTVDGKSGVRFMIDGKLQQLPATQMISVLSSMSAEAVASIELIKNPPAKYDASGTAGLINIVIKKAKLKGFNGSISESAGYGKRFGSGSALSLNFKSDKLSVFTNINYMNRDLVDVSLSTRRFSDNSIRATGESETFKSALTFTGGLEYDLTPKTTIGFNLNDDATATNYSRKLTTGVESGNAFNYNYFTAGTHSADKLNSPSANVYAVHTFDTVGTVLSFSADYTNFLFHELQLNENHFFDQQDVQVSPMLGYNSITDLDFKIATQKLDFTKSFSKLFTLETGLKSSFVENSSHSELEQNLPGSTSYFTNAFFSNVYDYKERVLAGYVNLITNFKKITLQTGIRAEQTTINAINKTTSYKLNRNYINFFPTVSADYKLNENNSVQFSYSYRIDRPSYDQLNPGKIFNDQLDYWSGNPELKPQYSHNFNVDINHKNFITNSFSFTHVDNSIYYFSYTNASQVSVDTVFNFASKNMLAYTLSVQKQFTQWYVLQFSGMLAYMNAIGKVNGASGNSEAYACKGSMNNEFALPQNFKVQLNISGSTPFRDGIQRYSERLSVDLAVQKRFFKNKLNVSIGIYDIFYTDYGTMTSTLPDQYTSYLQKSDTRRVRLNLSYRFGNMRIARKVNEGKSEESTRIKKAN